MTEPVIDSRVRSLLKGLTWRVVATLTTIAIAWLITGDVSAALQIGFIEVFAKIAIYYVHERAWAHLPIGRLRAYAGASATVATAPVPEVRRED